MGLTSCSNHSGELSWGNKIITDTSANSTQQTKSTTTDSLTLQKNELTKIYTQAIGDYIELVNEEYNLTFDTLFFGKHVFGQSTDFSGYRIAYRY